MSHKIISLVDLRWYVSMAVALVLFSLELLHIYDVWLPSYGLVALYTLSNMVLFLCFRRRSSRFDDLIFFGILTLDLVLLTVLLATNGGAHNPFTVLFMLLGGVAAMNISWEYVVGIIGISLISLWVLYNEPSFFWGMESVVGSHGHPGFHLHLIGMWLANSAGVVVMSLWMYRLRRHNETLAARHQESQKILLNVEKMESMGRLMAATAHNLNTPLATLQLGISEMANRQAPLTKQELEPWVADFQIAIDKITRLFADLRENQVQSALLSQESAALEMYLDTVINQWASVRGVKVTYHSYTNDLIISASLGTELSAVLESLLENAYDARSPERELHIQVELDARDAVVKMKVSDNGLGMNPEVLSHASQPLYTTKTKGTGLGLYIARQCASRLGGLLKIESIPARGTTILLTMARERIR